MKELFTDFLTVSISGSLILCLVLLLRLVFKRAPKALVCLLWLVAILRLLLPIQLEASWSLRPETPILSVADTQLFTEGAKLPESDVPAFVPQVPVEDTPDTVMVDYLAVAGVIWIVGVCVMGLYTMISYMRLKYRVREAVRMDKGVYVAANLDTAFLLGYFQPRVYLPAGLAAGEAELVVAHERAHIRRGDNWLKLIGFLCLAVHWYNPLMWFSYVLLCCDIEDACDEAVIRNLETEERKAYSAALLSCGRKGKTFTACPVAFGEISIRQRILNVLNYRKPTVWICIALVIVMVLAAVFFMTDPMQKHPPYYEEMMDLLGQPMGAVCDGLGIAPEALVEAGNSTGIYDTPITVEFEGVEFILRLGFSYHNDLLSSFTYYTLYENDPETAAADIATIANQSWKAFGKGFQWEEQEDPYRLRDLTEESALEMIQDEDANNVAWDHWDLTGTASKSARTYLNQIEISSVWREHYGERARLYDVSPHFYLTLRATKDSFQNVLYVAYEYSTGWQPGHYHASYGSDYD